MRIGIDCRMYGLEHAGSGRYILNLVENLLKIDNQNQYVLFVRKNFPDNELFKKEKVKLVIADAQHYSLKEQLLFPCLIHKAKIDLMHFPQFNFPILYSGKYIVTIHDLIKHTSRGTATTTRNRLFYWLKYLGYLVVFWLVVKRAKKILVPSETIAIQLRKAYNLNEKKVVVTYEGVDDNLRVKSQKSKVKEVFGNFKIDKPYLLYVGSIYPHKNISNLIKAVKIVNQSPIASHQPPVTLVVVCARSVFWERLKKELKNLEAQNYIKLVGFVPDEELAILYQEAKVFVFPSEAEGFGLPGLEAMAAGLPVLASNIPVFKEVYQDAVLYFDQKNPQDIAGKIKELLTDNELQGSLRKRGFEVVRKYSWLKTARETLNEYQKV